MEDQILDAPADVQKKLNYAGFWIRVVAYLLDGLLIGLVNFALMSLFPVTDSLNPALNIPVIIALVLFGIGYFSGMESSSRQATLGKMAVGIKVGNEKGQRIGFANALGRYFAKLLSAIILYIGFMMVGWDDKKQGLHDKLAGTYVFYAR